MDSQVNIFPFSFIDKLFIDICNQIGQRLDLIIPMDDRQTIVYNLPDLKIFYSKVSLHEGYIMAGMNECHGMSNTV